MKVFTTQKRKNEVQRNAVKSGILKICLKKCTWKIKNGSCSKRTKHGTIKEQKGTKVPKIKFINGG